MWSLGDHSLHRGGRCHQVEKAAFFPMTFWDFHLWMSALCSSLMNSEDVSFKIGRVTFPSRTGLCLWGLPLSRVWLSPSGPEPLEPFPTLYQSCTGFPRIRPSGPSQQPGPGPVCYLGRSTCAPAITHPSPSNLSYHIRVPITNYSSYPLFKSYQGAVHVTP